MSAKDQKSPKSPGLMGLGANIWGGVTNVTGNILSASASVIGGVASMATDSVDMLNSEKMQQKEEERNKMVEFINEQIRSLTAAKSLTKVPKNRNFDELSGKNTWSECNAETFSCRVGPNYQWTGTKEPSAESLYECVGVDWIKSEYRVDDIPSKIKIPDTFGEGKSDDNISGLPPLLAVNIQVPADNALALFAECTDGAGFSLVFYFKITQQTMEYAKDLSTAPPAVRLLAQYCKEAPEVDADPNSEWRGRFKAIIRCENIEIFNFPPLITGYNAKPVLIKQTGTLTRGESNSYIIMDINGHRFNNFSKGALQQIMKSFDDIISSFAFCIESKTDEEMPECIFGCATVHKPSLDGGIEILMPPEDDEPKSSNAA